MISPEEYLLFLSARIELDSEAGTRIENTLKQNPDWAKVTIMAEQLGVQPLLCKHLSESRYAPYVPDEVMLGLQENFRRQSIRSLRMQSLVNQILKTMNQSGIPIILLKGAFLAKWIYKDIALRPMNDIDILCRDQDRDIVKEKMNNIGYYQQKIVYQSSVHEKFFADSDLGVIVPGAPGQDRFPPFLNKKGNKVDIHFSIFSELPDDAGTREKFSASSAEIMQNIWESASLSALNGEPACFLSPEDQVLYLSVHLYKHLSPDYGGITLYWFCDIHELIKYYGKKTDWDKFCTRAESIGVGPQAGYVLDLIRENWRTPVPNDVLRSLGRETQNLSLKDIIRKKSDYQLHYAKIIRQVKKISGWKNQIFFLLGFVFPSQEYLIFRYQPKKNSLVWLYYVIHPCALLIKIFRKIFLSRVCIF